MANRYMKRYSTSPIREMKVKMTLSYQILPIRMASIKKTREKDATKSLGCNKSRPKKEVYSSIGLPQEARKISNNLILKGARKRTNKPPNLLEERE